MMQLEHCGGKRSLLQVQVFLQGLALITDTIQGEFKVAV